MNQPLLRRAFACVAISTSLLLPACNGGGDAPESNLSPETVGGAVITLAVAGQPNMLDAARVNTLQVEGSTAQVTLPAHALVDQETGEAVKGSVDVTLTVLSPASNPSGMAAGIYEARNPSNSSIELIESFGAIAVQLEQNDRRVQLAKGQSASIRIPLSTRASDRPASIPLYYWDDQQALWIQEGSAQLRGDASSGYYYEGTVTHFTVWNADRPINESVVISGCVNDKQGVPVPANQFTVISNGLDYSGMAMASKPQAGQFRVLAKKGGLIELGLSTGGSGVATTPVGAHIQDTTLASCLVLEETPSTPAAPGNFELLFLQLLQATNVQAAAAFSSIDPSSEMPTMLTPSTVCNVGSVSGLTLNGQPVTGGEAMRLNTQENLRMQFNACEPRTLDMVTLLGNGSDSLFSFSGFAESTLLMQSGDNNSFSLTIRSNLTDLRENSSQLNINGQFMVHLSDTSGIDIQDADTFRSSMHTAAPSPGASITNLVSQRTAVFKSGQITHINELDRKEWRFNALRYTIGNDEYILDGTIGTVAGTRVTIQKNGAISAVLRGISSSGWDVVGQVDPI